MVWLHYSGKLILASFSLKVHKTELQKLPSFAIDKSCHMKSTDQFPYHSHFLSSESGPFKAEGHRQNFEVALNLTAFNSNIHCVQLIKCAIF